VPASAQRENPQFRLAWSGSRRYCSQAFEPSVFEDERFSRWILSRRQRVASVGCALLLAGLLALAATLNPDRRGLGTHQQLGLPPCTIQSWFHVRCPSCGMTTSWAHFVRGRWIAAGEANLGGALLACSAAAAVPWLAGSAFRGRWWLVRPSEWTWLAFCMSAVLITIMDWLFRVMPEWVDHLD
jgi:hypothetical protein